MDDRVLLDADIREPLILYLEQYYGKVRFLEELVTGKARADIVMVLPDKVCGIEIKSDADSYARLADQVRNYDRYYDENYIVVGSTHALHAAEHVPEHWGMQFMEAMKILADETLDLHDPDTKREYKSPNAECKKLLLPEKSESNLDVIRYLTARGIDREIIRDCIDEGLLYESLPYHNCIFVGYDEAGKAAYACYRATNGEKIMGDAAGSDKKYSFRVNRAGSTIHVFESAIDLLSYATIMKMKTLHTTTALRVKACRAGCQRYYMRLL